MIIGHKLTIHSLLVLVGAVGATINVRNSYSGYHKLGLVGAVRARIDVRNSYSGYHKLGACWSGKR